MSPPPIRRRKLLLDEMQDGLKSLEQMSGSESMAQLRLKAHIHELKGESIEAMATYQRALNLMERNGVKEYDVMNDAARLDLQLGQTGSAMKLLSQIVDYNGSYIPARLFLAQIYLQQGDPDSAQQQLDVVEKLAPQSPELSKLRIAQLSQQKKPEAAKAVYAKLPESNLNERLTKAQARFAVEGLPRGDSPAGDHPKGSARKCVGHARTGAVVRRPRRKAEGPRRDR